MPKKVKPLDDSEIRGNIAKDKQFKKTDGDGLYLLVTPMGGKLWRFDYSHAGKRKTIAMGKYPDISLAKARERRRLYREQVADGLDPGELKKAPQDDTDTFETVAREWHKKNYSSWIPGYADQILRRLENDIFNVIGSKPIESLKPRDVLKPLQKIEARGAVETAHRIKQVIGMIFRYAVATGRADRDPTPDLRGALSKVQVSHHASITDPKKVGGLLRAVDGYEGSFIVKSALQLAPLVFVRPGELRKAEWSEIDLDKAEWNIPPEKLKVKREGAHLVPLSTQAVDILKAIKPLTGSTRYVFPCHRSTARPMSDNALNGALRRMDFKKSEMTAHGFRATARTILDEELGFRPDIIEHQLAHVVKDPNGRAYNRTKFLKERKEMMQKWADYLDGLRKGAKVVPLKVNGWAETR